MNTLTIKLDQLEARLQTLIEGHIARLLPAQLSKDEITRQMIAAMQAVARQDEEGTLLAPDTFFIQLHPQHISALPGPEMLLAELADLIQQAGAQAGFAFRHPPTVNLVAESEMEPDDIDIVARISPGFHEETHGMAVETESNTENIPQNTFIIVDGDQIFSLEKSVVNIGRMSDNELVIDDPRISRQHAQLRATQGRYILFDLDSTGGTFVNGRRVTQCTLHPRDVISLAGVPLVYAQEGAAPLDSTQRYTPPASPDDDQPTKGSLL